MLVFCEILCDGLYCSSWCSFVLLSKVFRTITHHEFVVACDASPLFLGCRLNLSLFTYVFSLFVDGQIWALCLSFISLLMVKHVGPFANHLSILVLLNSCILAYCFYAHCWSNPSYIMAFWKDSSSSLCLGFYLCHFCQAKIYVFIPQWMCLLSCLEVEIKFVSGWIFFLRCTT